MTKSSRITKERFNRLYCDDISKREYDNIISDIDKRFSDIVILLIPTFHKGCWFDYGNCRYDGENSGGYFDCDKYKEYIQIGGENDGITEFHNENFFPTKWLWTDDDEILKSFNAVIAKAKADKEKKRISKKQKSEVRNLKKLDMEKNIASKLTEEEVRYIIFNKTYQIKSKAT